MKNRRRATGNRPDKTRQVFVDGSTIRVSRNGKLSAPSAGGGAGGGTVTSVGLSATPSSVFGVSGSPVTGSGTLALTLDDQSANRVLAGPASGADATPAFRALVNDDLPNSGAAAGTYFSANVTVNAKGVVTSIEDGRIDQDGLISPAVLPARTVSNMKRMHHIPALDKVLFTESSTNGKLRQIDRTFDAPLDLSGTYTSKAVTAFAYSSISTKIYLGYGTAVMSVNSTTGAIVTDPIGSARAESGIAVRASNGNMYGASFSGGAVYRWDPSTDTQIGSGVAIPANVTNACNLQYNSIAHCPTDDHMYVAGHTGLAKYDCTTDTFGTSPITGLSSNGNGSVIYCSDVDRIFYCQGVTGNLYKVQPTTGTVTTYAFPSWYTASNKGGDLCELGDYIYVGTLSGVGQVMNCILIFKKSTNQWVGCLSHDAFTDIRGPLAGVAAEGVLYSGGLNSGNANDLVVFGRVWQP